MTSGNVDANGEVSSSRLVDGNDVAVQCQPLLWDDGVDGCRQSLIDCTLGGVARSFGQQPEVDKSLH